MAVMPCRQDSYEGWRFLPLSGSTPLSWFLGAGDGDSLEQRRFPAFRYPLQALAPTSGMSGPIVCRVRLGGILIGDDSVTWGTSCEILWEADASKVLHEFACWCAEQALLAESLAHRKTSPLSWAAVAGKRAWLRGEISDDQLAVLRRRAHTVSFLSSDPDSVVARVRSAVADCAASAAEVPADVAAYDAAFPWLESIDWLWGPKRRWEMLMNLEAKLEESLYTLAP